MLKLKSGAQVSGRHWALVHNCLCTFSPREALFSPVVTLPDGRYGVVGHLTRADREEIAALAIAQWQKWASNVGDFDPVI